MKEEKKEKEKKETVDTKQQRINKCTEEMNKLLDQYGCKLNCYFIVTARGNFPKVEVNSK